MGGAWEQLAMMTLCINKRKERSTGGSNFHSSRLWMLVMITLYTAIIATIALTWGSIQAVPKTVATTVTRITLGGHITEGDDDIITSTPLTFQAFSMSGSGGQESSTGRTLPLDAKEAQGGLLSLAQTFMGHWSHEPDTLVIYIYADTEPESRSNLEFFLENAVQESDRAQYIIVVQKASENTTLIGLPSLPHNAQYVLHANECYDWGTVGWLMFNSSVPIERSRYKYFVIMNSSVRGPYFPAFLQGRIHWTDPFTSKLSDRVKLVGSTISCEGVMHNGELRRNAHVQSYVVATDQIGLELLIRDGNVLSCHHERSAAIYHAELGSSLAVFNAGYNVDSLLMRYQGVDWRDKSNWNCNGVESPLNEYMYDGTSIDPFEVVFVKMKRFMVDSGISYAVKADKYGRWPEEEQVNSNDYRAKESELQFSQIVEAIARSRRCFDSAYYKASNPDLKLSVPDSDIARWRHFVFEGQFRYRPHRWLCPTEFSKLIDEMKKWPQLSLQPKNTPPDSTTGAVAAAVPAVAAAATTATPAPVAAAKVAILATPAEAVPGPAAHRRLGQVAVRQPMRGVPGQ